jgi:hypothetical protein
MVNSAGWNWAKSLAEKNNRVNKIGMHLGFIDVQYPVFLLPAILVGT